MNNLLTALGTDVKATGKDKWVCRCPVHNDKDFAMSIKICADNSVVAHCFACGANGLDLYRELGLSLDELFGGKELGRNHIPYEIQDNYDMDKSVLLIHKHDVAAGFRISYNDKKRVKLAVARIEGIKRKFPHIR